MTLMGVMGVSYVIFICKGRSCDSSFKSSPYPHYFGEKIFQLLSYRSPRYQKMKIYLNCDDYRIASITYIRGMSNSFSKLLATHATIKYGVWARSCPFCYFFLIFKSRTITKSLRCTILNTNPYHSLHHITDHYVFNGRPCSSLFQNGEQNPRF